MLGGNITSLILLSSDTITSDAGKVVDKGGRDYIGGGDVLKYTGGAGDNSWHYMNGPLITDFQNMGIVKAAICVGLIIICIILIMKMFGRRSLFRDKAIKEEIDNINNLRKQDAKIIRYNKLLSKTSKYVKKFGLDVGKSQEEYMEYNLKRAGVMAPGGQRVMTPNEFNALIKTGTGLTTILSILLMLFVSVSFGTLILIGTLVCWAVLPMQLLRSTVAEKDGIIKDNFFSFYADIHYELKAGGRKSLTTVIRSYDTIAPNAEMAKFASNCADLMDLYTESEGTKYITQEYREIPEVGKLMRLIKQFNDNADISNDLDGFREQLLLVQQFNVDKHSAKLEEKARRSFSLIMVVLVQAILSAMMIYLPDLTNISSFF